MPARGVVRDPRGKGRPRGTSTSRALGPRRSRASHENGRSVPMSSRNGSSWVVVVVAGPAPGGAATSFAQEPEKTFAERAKEYWGKVVSGMESGAKAAGDEYHKLKTEAAEATGP